jgi:hypothetical protein
LDEQTEHAAPPEPQAAFAVPGWQAPVVSTHVVHWLLDSQAPSGLHTWPAVQSWHAPPFTPQAAAAVPASQFPVPSQQPWQPAVQLVPPTQAPVWHAWPTWHAVHARPVIPQAANVVPSWQWSVLSQQPSQFEGKQCAVSGLQEDSAGAKAAATRRNAQNRAMVLKGVVCPGKGFEVQGDEYDHA